MLSVNEISKNIKDKKILDNVSFNVEFGSIYGLLGPNGAGKTSSFYIIAGLTTSDKGLVQLAGEDITNMPMHKRSKLGIKYLPQEPSIFQNLTVYENLLGLAELTFSSKEKIKNFIDESIEEFNLENICNLKGRQYLEDREERLK